MKLSDVISLIQAGYNKEEIEQFEAMERAGETVERAREQPKQPEQPQQPKETPAAEPPKAKAENLETMPDFKGLKDSIDGLFSAVDGMTKALQVGNIRASSQPGTRPEQSLADEADKVLMSIYNI